MLSDSLENPQPSTSGQNGGVVDYKKLYEEECRRQNYWKDRCMMVEMELAQLRQVIKPNGLLLELSEMALRKVVVNLWSATNVRDAIGNFPFEMVFISKAKCWERTVENKVQKKISKLVIPAALKRRIKNIAKPIGLQIAEWVNFMKKCLNDSEETLYIHLLNHLCWTSAGAIQYERTAEKLASLPTLDIVKRFKIACAHCLVESLPVIWQDLPEESKKEFFEPFFNPIDTNCSFYKKYFLEIYWAYFLKGEENKLLESRRNFYRHALKFSARRGNKAATEYFFQKLSSEERDSFLSLKFCATFNKFLLSHDSDFPREECTDAFCYLLSQMTPEEQIQALEVCPGYVIFIFLTWRSIDLFLDKTDLIWKFPNKKEAYDHVLYCIGRKIQHYVHYFPEMIHEFIRRSPRDFKEHLVNEETQRPGSLFYKLLHMDGKETIKVILRSMEDEDKFRIVSSEHVFHTFSALFSVKGHALVELCIREACQDKENRKRLEDIYMEFVNTSYAKEWISKWHQFFEAINKLDEIILKKRRSENGTETRAKKCIEKEKRVP